MRKTLAGIEFLSMFSGLSNYNACKLTFRTAVAAK